MDTKKQSHVHPRISVVHRLHLWLGNAEVCIISLACGGPASETNSESVPNVKGRVITCGRYRTIRVLRNSVLQVQQSNNVAMESNETSTREQHACTVACVTFTVLASPSNAYSRLTTRETVSNDDSESVALRSTNPMRGSEGWKHRIGGSTQGVIGSEPVRVVLAARCQSRGSTR
jgi:hypothetical protein